MAKQYNMRYPITTEENIPDITINPDQIPHIDGTTGNWFVGDVNTGVKAQGPTGPAGQNGAPGTSGETGPQGPAGTPGATGPKGDPGTNGTDGTTPHIDPTSKHWMIGTVDTNIVAEGLQGPAGADGTNGTDGQRGPKGNPGNDGITPSINPTNKHWMIGDTDTNVLAEGVQGPQGPTGQTGASGATGEQGPQGIQGPPGADGAQGIQGVPGNDGAPGTNGIDGKSAYAYAQAGGYTGSEAEFTAAIVKAANCVTLDEVKALGYMKAEKVTALPASPDPNTVYFVTG